jgi:hypothetical protein
MSASDGPPDFARSTHRDLRAEAAPIAADRGRTERAPLVLFDRATDARERAVWATEVASFLTSPVGPDVPQDAVVLALLPSDVIAAWMDEIESNERTVIVTAAPAVSTDGARSSPIVLELIPTNLDVNNAEVSSTAAARRMITPSDRAEDLAAAALDGCTNFRWATRDERVDLDARILFPLETRAR